MTESAPIAELSDNSRQRLQELRYLGTLDKDIVEKAACTFVEMEHGADQATDHITLQLSVDEQHYVRQVAYRTLATGAALLAFDVMAELCVGITMDQVARITPEHVQQHAKLTLEQERLELPWPSTATFPVLTKITRHYQGKPLDEEEETPQKTMEFDGPPWDELGLFEKVRRIELVLDEQVRPMLASDGGGMDLVDLRDDTLVVQYHGACGSCSSSVGGTMFFIEDTLNNALGTRLSLDVQGGEPEPFVDL